MSSEELIDVTVKWGAKKLGCLAADVNVARLRQPRPILADEPLLSSIVLSDADAIDLHMPLKHEHRKEPYWSSTDSWLNANHTRKPPPPQLQPTVDSYIINTIKLNQILQRANDGEVFNDPQLFKKRKKTVECEVTKKESATVLISSIYSDAEARAALRDFVVIMSMHCGFTEASPFALDIIVDVLEHYIESFFKLFKNLQQVHQVALTSDAGSRNQHTVASTHFYASEQFVSQVFAEAGMGTLKELREFYLNDIVSYHRQTYAKVSRLWQEYKTRAQNEAAASNASVQSRVFVPSEFVKSNNEMSNEVEEFMRENDFLNDESNSLLGDLLTDLNPSHYDDEMNKLLQIIGSDPFSLIAEEIQNSH